MDSKRYNNIKIGVGIGKAVISFLLIMIFVVAGFSERLTILLYQYSSSNYIVLLLFIVVIGIVSSVLFFPLNYYVSFYLEHKYKLSNQTFFQWIWENFKGVLVGGVIGIPVLLIFYYLLNLFGNWWWLPFAAIMFVLSVLLVRIVPILILPIFYKITPIDEGNLRDKIVNLASESGMKVENVFKFNMSKNTKKANAAFTGLGKTKRIILGDTLLENYSDEEIESVIAHELGHYVYKHILKNVVFGTVMSFLTFYAIAQFYEISLSWFNFNEITEIAALPVLSLWGMLIGVIQTPISNIISRKF